MSCGGARVRLAALALLAILPAAGCGHRNGRLEAVWTGSETGRTSSRATAIWCPGPRVAVVTGIRGDTGVSVLIHARDSLTSGRYPILDPAAARHTAPSAAVGLRLVSRTSVVGYQGQSGTLKIAWTAEGELTGDFTATAKIASELAGMVKLTGRFRKVRVATDGADCPR